MGPGRNVVARALIDSGSEAKFVTHRLQRKLGLPTKPTSVQVTVVNCIVSAQISKSCEFSLTSTSHGIVPVQVTGLVIPVLTGNNPRGQPLCSLEERVQLQLADPRFYKGEEVDILIGGDYYPRILRQELRQGVLGSFVV